VSSNAKAHVIIPISTVLTATTGVTIPYMVDVGVAWVWLTVVL